ncbi:MAG: FAD-binding oxidoreductase, partial [Halobacteriales archaeon]|nr:FAD-binding oxidoreductase [Halobacteriales archaeon]
VLNSDEEIRMPLTFFEDGYYLREEGERQAFAGKLGTDYDTAVDVDPDAAHSVDETMYQEMATLIEEAVPGLADAEISSEWVGVRTVTPDGHPFVGPTDVNRFHVAVGMSGHGVTLAPAVGTLLAEYITTGDRPPLLEPLLPGRETARRAP